MQVKALAILATLLAALALAACGGGGDETSTSPSTTAGDAPQSAQEAKGLEELHRRAKQVRREREHESSKGGEPPSGKKQAPPVNSGQAAQVEVREHHDSGGGVGQFQNKGGDNSIQELGQEASDSDREDAAAALHGYLDARVTGHWDVACSYLSADTVAALEQFASSYEGEKKLEGCPDILVALTAQGGKAVLQRAANVDVGALRQQGDHGFLLYHGADKLDYAIPVVEEAGTWKLSAPEGTLLP